MSAVTESINALTGRARILGFFATLLLLALACTPADAALIQGILQDVDSANGEITIVTEDGKTITLTISIDASVNTEGASSSVETLEPGVSIEVNVAGDGEHATKIYARQSKVHGTVTGINGNEVSILAENGIAFVVIVDESTRIGLEEDSHGSLTSIPIGAEIEAKFDPDTGVAFKLDLEQEKAEIEGWAEGIVGDQVTIKTEHGRILTLTVGEDTRIELADDSLGTLADIVDGLKIEVDFDPSSLAVFKIELKRDEAEIEGRVENIEADQVTIRTEDGYELTVAVGENVRIELADDSLGTFADIVDGLKIEVDFDPSSFAAFEIEIEQDDADENDEHDVDEEDVDGVADHDEQVADEDKEDGRS